MNRLLGMLALVAAIALPTIAQVQRMTSDDEAKFDGYMEHHMQHIMNKYRIPPDTPYDQVASQNGAYPTKVRIMTAIMIAIVVTRTKVGPALA